MTTNRNKWIIGGVIVGGIAIVALVMRRKTLANTGPSYIPTGPTSPTPTQPNPTTGITNPPTGPVGKNAYVGQPGLIVRSSPELNDAWFGLFGGNNLGAINGVGTWLGVVKSTATDMDKAKNKSTGQPYIWYELTINPALLLLPGNKYYVREDYTNLK